MNAILSLALAFLFASQAALAGGGGGGFGNIVYDPTNHAENLVTAARSVYAETQRATQIYNQMQHYRQMLLQNRQMDPTVMASLLSQNRQEMLSLQTYIGGMSRLIGDSEQLANLAKSRGADLNQSGLSFQEYAQREQERVAAGEMRRAELAAHEVAVMQSVNRDAQFVQDMQEKIPGAVGVNESTMLMNAQLNKIVAQNATLIQLQAVNSANQRADAARAEASRADQEQRLRDASKNSKTAIQAEIQRLEGLLRERSVK